MSNVVCCPLSGNGDYGAEVYHDRIVTARKAHKCCECEEWIPNRSEHEVVSGKWDGSWRTYRTCLSCVEIRNHFQCNGWLFGYLWSDLEDNFFPEMRAGGPCMEGLSPSAKERLFERRTAWLLARGRTE